MSAPEASSALGAASLITWTATGIPNQATDGPNIILRARVVDEHDTYFEVRHAMTTMQAAFIVQEISDAIIEAQTGTRPKHKTIPL